MAYKPMDESTYLGYLKVVSWRLIKGGIDYNLFDEKGVFRMYDQNQSRKRKKTGSSGFLR